MAGKTIPDRVTKRIQGQPAKDHPKARSMPISSSVFKKTRDMQQAVELLEQAISTKELFDEVEPKLDSLKKDLAGVCAGNDIPGFRHGTNAVCVDITPGRKMLSKDKLLEFGVDPQIIADSMVEGEPYYKVSLVKLPG